jgi:hypothetical protein
VSEYLLSKGDGEPSQAGGYALESYFRREGQAELMIPYSFPVQPGETFWGAVWKSRVHRYLIDIDGPWLFAFVLSILVCALWRAVAVYGGYQLLLASISAVGSWPFVLIALYLLIAGLNFRLRYGRQWLRTLMGPTHLGLSQTGIKCYWKGQFFYNYPLLRTWTNVRKVEIELPAPDDLLSQANIFFSFVGSFTLRTDMRLPIAGFRSRAHLIAFLNYLNKHLPEVSRGEQFKQDSEKAFERTLKLFDESKRFEIELSS